MRSRLLLLAGSFVLLGLLAFGLSRADEPAPTARPTSLSTTPMPTQGPAANGAPNRQAILVKRPPPPKPFKVRLAKIRMSEIDNAELYGNKARKPARKAGRKAVRAARARLVRYLNAQFVEPTTRFGPKPAQRLLSRRARQSLGKNDRRALGHLDLPVAQIKTGKASARARVLLNRRRAIGVTLTWRARLQVTLQGGRKRPIRQQGTLLLVRGRPRWMVSAVDAQLDLGVAKKAKQERQRDHKPKASKKRKS